MRVPTSEKLEIIRLVEHSHLPNATDAANTWHPVLDILPMVCALPDRRAGGTRRQTVEAGSGLESHPRRGARTHHRDGPGARMAMIVLKTALSFGKACRLREPNLRRRLRI